MQIVKSYSSSIFSFPRSFHIFSITIALIYTCSNNVQEFPFLHTFQCLSSLDIGILTGAIAHCGFDQYFPNGSINVVNGDTSSLTECLSRFTGHSKSWIIYFYAMRFWSSLYGPEIRITNIFFHR